MNIFRYWKSGKKILGLNVHSLDLVSINKLHKSKLLADSKLSTKLLLHEHGIASGKVFAIIKNRDDLLNFDFSILPNSFVLKPNRGVGGSGIIVAFAKSKKGDYWISSSRKKITKEYLINHISNILDGKYSLENISDIAFFEERIKIDPVFKNYSYRGIPDIRIIVFNKVPIMAMLRLPTRESEGKANLNSGGIGIGIDIASGKTTFAIKQHPLFADQYLDFYPGKYKLSLHGIEIPHWNYILKLAVKVSSISKLNYSGVDIAIDREKGPVILELNAKPGLSIQNANLAGLKERVDRVSGLKVKSIENGINIAKNLFGGSFEEELELLYGKEVIGLFNKVAVLDEDKKELINIVAKIDTGIISSSLDREIANQLGFAEALAIVDNLKINIKVDRAKSQELEKQLLMEVQKETDLIEKIRIIYSVNNVLIRPYIKVKLKIEDFIFDTVVSIVDRKNMKYKLILGRNDLKNFLIDPNKT